MKKMAYALVVVVAMALAVRDTQYHISAHRITYIYKRDPNFLPISLAAPQFLEAHNKARAAVGVGPLKWSPSLANFASKLVSNMVDGKRDCNFADLSRRSRMYHIGSSNQHWAGGWLLKPRMVVDKWVEEKKYYNHTDNSCKPRHKCGSYTQVVWRKSLEVGCAQKTCYKFNRWVEMSGITICFYSPRGNVPGQRPY